MCGIVGAVLTNKGLVSEYLLKPLQQLEYRGYDSCGYFATDFKDSSYKRSVGEVKKLLHESRDIEFSQGIAHTRWATHGSVTHENSHPQTSSNRIYVVHNGVIDNYQEIKLSLLQKGYVFESDTDTEVIAHLIHFYVSDLNISYPTSTAVCMAMIDLKGKFSFIVIDSETGTMVAVNNGRPLIIFRDDENITIASDVAAFTGKLSGEIYYMKDGDVCEINENIQKVRRVELINGTRVQEKIMTEFHTYSPELPLNEKKMRTIMEAEIYQQSIAVTNTLNSESVDEIQALFTSSAHPEHLKKIRLIGCGTSYHAAQMGAKWLKVIADIDATAHIASEFANQTAIDNDTNFFVFISQSGETADTLAAIETVNQFAPHKTVSICNVPQSELVRNSKYHIMIQAGTERSVASTKAFTCQLIALLKFSLAIGAITKRGMGSISFITEDIENEMNNLPALLRETIETASIQSKMLAELINPKKGPSHAVFLGRDIMYPIALEGALKLAEIAYIPSLTYFTGELKHGPLALIDEKAPVFVVFSSKEVNITKMFSSLNQVQARGGRIFLISDRLGIDAAKSAGIKPIASFTIPSIPRYEYILEPILAMIPLQLIAHEIALKLRKNVDRPRNLAKSVTVE